MARETADRESPNIPNREKSVHSTTAMNEPRVRIRHPEYHKMRADAEIDNATVQFLAGQDPEEGTVSLDTPCEPFSDIGCYPLDDFNRTLTGGTYSAGSSAGTYTHWIATAYGDSRCYIPDGSGGDSFTFIEDTTAIKDKEVWSSLGTRATSHPWNPGCGCTGLDFTFTGWKETSVWHKVTMTTPPANMAGVVYGPITFIGKVGLSGGTVAYNAGGLLAVSKEEPTSVRSGTVIAALPTGVSKSVYIPAAYIPAEGEALYIGILPAWQANLGDYTCGFRWPWMDGQGNSGEGYYNEGPTVTYQTWDVTGDDWGSGLTDEAEAGFFDGGLPWQVSPSGGTFGYDGDNLYLTAPAGGVETLVAHMPGLTNWGPDDSEDGVYGEPWTSEFGVRMKMRFKLTTAGSTTESGTRELRATWHDGRTVQSVAAHLGDTNRVQGISVADEIDVAFTAKDITEDSWMWLSLDSRNREYLRGKMWVEGTTFGSGEPAIYDVELGLTDDSESPTSDNYFELRLSVGNETGADQTIRVDGIWFCNGADDCMWVQERIGQGDSLTNQFATSLPYKEGSLWFFVDGMHVRTTTDDSNKGTFWTLDTNAPAENAVLIARYRVDGNPDGD